MIGKLLYLLNNQKYVNYPFTTIIIIASDKICLYSGDLIESINYQLIYKQIDDSKNYLLLLNLYLENKFLRVRKTKGKRSPVSTTLMTIFQ
jgi:hypothetical protein